MFVLGATLLACPAVAQRASARRGGRRSSYMSGTCTSKTLMAAAGANANDVLSVAPLMDPNDPAVRDERGDDALQGEVGAVPAAKPTPATASSRTAGRRRAIARGDARDRRRAEPARRDGGRAHADRPERDRAPTARRDVDGRTPTTGSSARRSTSCSTRPPTATSSRSASCIDDRRRDRGDHAREPDQRLATRARATHGLARASRSVTISRPSRVTQPVAIARGAARRVRRTG